MRKLVILCSLSLTLDYVSNFEGETINQTEISKINNAKIEYLSCCEFVMPCLKNCIKYLFKQRGQDKKLTIYN